jgi:hypothetical protein
MSDHVNIGAILSVSLEQGSRATVRLGFAAVLYRYNDILSHLCLHYKQCDKLLCQTLLCQISRLRGELVSTSRFSYDCDIKLVCLLRIYSIAWNLC